MTGQKPDRQGVSTNCCLSLLEQIQESFLFAVRAVEPWNRLPDEMKLAANKEEKDPKTKDRWAANMV